MQATVGLTGNPFHEQPWAQDPSFICYLFVYLFVNSNESKKISAQYVFQYKICEKTTYLKYVHGTFSVQIYLNLTSDV